MTIRPWGSLTGVFNFQNSVEADKFCRISTGMPNDACSVCVLLLYVIIVLHSLQNISFCFVICTNLVQNWLNDEASAAAEMYGHPITLRSAGEMSYNEGEEN